MVTFGALMLRSAPFVSRTSSTTAPALFTLMFEERVSRGTQPGGTPVVASFGKSPGT